MAQPVAIPPPQGAQQQSSLKVRRALGQPQISPASLSLGPSILLRPPLLATRPSKRCSFDQKSAAYTAGIARRTLARHGASPGSSAMAHSPSSSAGRPRSGSCSLTILHLDTKSFAESPASVNRNVKGNGLALDFPSRPTSRAHLEEADQVRVHLAPDEALLPFLDRPTEVSELLRNQSNSHLLRRIEMTLREPEAGKLLSRLLFECPREELPDRAWLHQLKTLLCPRAPDLWASLSMTLGASHLDLRHEDEADPSQRQSSTGPLPTSGRRMSVRHDRWASHDASATPFDDDLASRPWPVTFGQADSAEEAPEAHHRESSSSPYGERDQGVFLEVEALHELPASFRKNARNINADDVATMLQACSSVLSAEKASSDASPGEQSQPSHRAIASDSTVSSSDTAEAQITVEAPRETGERKDIARARRDSTILTGEDRLLVDQTVKERRGAFAALRIRTRSLETAPTPAKASAPASPGVSDPDSATSTALSTPATSGWPSPVAGLSAQSVEKGGTTMQAKQDSKTSLPVAPFVRGRRLSQLMQPFLVDEASAKSTHIGGTPSSTSELRDDPWPVARQRSRSSASGRRGRSVQIDPLVVELSAPSSVDNPTTDFSPSDPGRLRRTNSDGSPTSKVTGGNPTSPGAPTMPEHARRALSFARSFGELTPIVPKLRRHTLSDASRGEGGESPRADSDDGDSVQQPGRARRQTVAHSALAAKPDRSPIEEVAEYEATGSPKPRDLGLLPDGRTRHPSAGAKGSSAALAAFRASLGMSVQPMGQRSPVPADPKRSPRLAPLVQGSDRDRPSAAVTSEENAQSSARSDTVVAADHQRAPGVQHAVEPASTASSRSHPSAMAGLELPKPKPAGRSGLAVGGGFSLARPLGPGVRRPDPSHRTSPSVEQLSPWRSLSPNTPSPAASLGSLPRTPGVYKREGGFSAFSREYQHYRRGRARASSSVSEAWSTGSQALATSDSEDDPSLTSPPLGRRAGAAAAAAAASPMPQYSPTYSFHGSLGLQGISEGPPREVSPFSMPEVLPPTAGRASKGAAETAARLASPLAPPAREGGASEQGSTTAAKEGRKRRQTIVFPIPPSASRASALGRWWDEAPDEVMAKIRLGLGGEDDKVAELRERLVRRERADDGASDMALLEEIGDEVFELADLEAAAAAAACDDDEATAEVRARAEERLCSEGYAARWAGFEALCEGVCRMDGAALAEVRKRSGPASRLSLRGGTGGGARAG